VLNESKLMIDKFIPYELINYVSESINKVSGLKVEYFQIVDGDNLQPVTSWSDSDYIVGCIALFCGEVRLIDNIRYK
jgi:pantoate--beta-alanine ligase